MARFKSELSFDDLLRAGTQTAPSGHAPSSALAASPHGWMIQADAILKNRDTRLDAEHYDPQIDATVRQLRQFEGELVTLGQLAEIDLPSQFTRKWAKSQEQGLPYVNATDLLCYMALGKLYKTPRFLSPETKVDIKRLTLTSDMLLLTCSGGREGLGRVYLVPEAFDGWVATHDIVRIRPRAPEMIGYLLAYLRSPFAQTQILSHTFGGQIDHIKDSQVATCLVPLLDPSAMRQISREVEQAERDRHIG